MKRTLSITTFLLLLAWLLPFSAAADEGGDFVETQGSRKYAVIVVGAAVNEVRSQTFGRWAFTLRKLLQEEYGYPPERVELLIGDGNGEGGVGSSQLETIRGRFAALAEIITPKDQLMVILIGHGTGRGDMAKFNIVGPDISGPQFAALLKAINTRNIVIINTTSASYDFSKALSANGRIVISATRSAAEKYDTLFTEFFVSALQNRAADRDKNGRVSMLEAFNFASAATQSHFKERGVLPTEHAVLDDNGDGVFSQHADPDGDGGLAELAYLGTPASLQQELSPVAAQARTRMQALERKIIALRGSKSALDEGGYWAQLEPLLIELAQVTREFDELSQP